jgi:hypothetical protein
MEAANHAPQWTHIAPCGRERGSAWRKPVDRQPIGFLLKEVLSYESNPPVTDRISHTRRP